MKTESKARILAALDLCFSLIFGQKDADYNADGSDVEDYWTYGMQSIMHEINKKVQRMKSVLHTLNKGGGDPNNVTDSLFQNSVDLISYSLFAVAHLIKIYEEQREAYDNGLEAHLEEAVMDGCVEHELEDAKSEYAENAPKLMLDSRDMHYKVLQVMKDHYLRHYPFPGILRPLMIMDTAATICSQRAPSMEDLIRGNVAIDTGKKDSGC